MKQIKTASFVYYSDLADQLTKNASLKSKLEEMARKFTGRTPENKDDWVLTLMHNASIAAYVVSMLGLGYMALPDAPHAKEKAPIHQHVARTPAPPTQQPYANFPDEPEVADASGAMQR